MTVTNGNSPSDVDVSISLVGPAECNPTLGPAGWRHQHHGRRHDRPDHRGWTAVNTARLHRAGHGFRRNPEHHPRLHDQLPGPVGTQYEFQVVVNASSDTADPDPSNNQDENHPVATVCCPDVDGDGDPNGADNCPTVANPSQPTATATASATLVTRMTTTIASGHDGRLRHRR